tara:strand:- start:7891 stop:8799 length:909 start_codon:yes stop_codon:yes gene_type:complete
MSENKQEPSVFSPHNLNTRVRAANYFETPPPPDLVFGGVLAASVAGIIAPGSTGKGFFSLGICFDLYTGKNRLGLDIKKLQSDQKVAFITAEDQGVVIGGRIHSMMKEYQMSSDECVVMDEQIHFISVAGQIVMDLVDQRGNVNYALANEMINEYRDYRLIFLDTLARMHTANENDNGNMSVLISVFEYIAKHTGAALVFMHHTNKSATLNALGGDQGAARGAAAITDNIRYQLNLSKVTKEDAEEMGVPEDKRKLFLWLHESKVNYKEAEEDKLFERGKGGVLKAVKNPRSYEYEDHSGDY